MSSETDAVIKNLYKHVNSLGMDMDDEFKTVSKDSSMVKTKHVYIIPPVVILLLLIFWQPYFVTVTDVATGKKHFSVNRLFMAVFFFCVLFYFGLFIYFYKNK